MRTIRVLFDESEASESIARRIVRAFNPGEIFQVRDKYFKVSTMRFANETIRANIVGDKYTLVLNVGEPEPVSQTPVVPPKPIVELVVSLPQVVVGPEVVQPEPPQTSLPEPTLASVPVTLDSSKGSTSKSGEYRIERVDAARVTKEGPPKKLPVVGQVWQTKDTRRPNSPPFTVLSVDAEFAYTDKGAKILLKRWRNYRLVDNLVEVSQQGCG